MPQASNPKKSKASVSQIPLFVHIKETIRKQILNGSYSVHDKLPSERELIESFKVSRITVRQALAELQREGLVFKINGTGTFVSKPKAALDVSKLRGFGEAMSSMGYESFARVLSIKEELAPNDITTKLNLSADSTTTKIQRLRYLNREPISLDITYFAPVLGKIIAAADLERRDILSVLENECGVALENAKVSIESQLCDDYLSRHLQVEAGGPILHIERMLFNTEHQPVLYENLFYRGDVFRYSLDIER
ncbi:MAG: GntR family transcriptional regulator [Cellvibrionaceae bacterium]|jgi:GntR family transcriptional regulator